MTEPRGELEYRSAEPVDVSWPRRTIELVVMPYEHEAAIYWQGRVITEICSRGAWDGIERRANRVRANRDHDVTRTVGRASALHPSRVEGLVADVHIASTALGDETLTLAADGILDVSAGFLPMAGGETWETRDRRRLTKCWLGHIAFVPDPAYDDAAVLAVRHAGDPPAVSSSTPVLDRIIAERNAREYGLVE
jgi:phage head maturation protease